MKFTINLSEINCQTLFEKALNTTYKSNFFDDLRRVFREEVNFLINKAGLKILPTLNYEYSGKLITSNSFEFDPLKSKYNNGYLDLKFCAGYGTNALKAINYQNREYIDLTSLYTFKKIENFSIGNFIFFVENENYEIEVIKSDKIKCVGYSYEISKRKRKSFFCLFGIHFSENELKLIFDKYSQESDPINLDEVRFGYSKYPILFASRITGKIYTCECFKEHINWKWDFWRNVHLEQAPDIKHLIDKVEYKKGICHLCMGETPKLQYGSSMYFSSFLQKYLPYYELEHNKNKIDSINSKELENELRVKVGFPKIGEKWISETILYQMVKEIFTEREVIFHYRGKELQGLEIDIFIPSLKLGFEYQGQQHFESIKHWGGEEGLKKRKANDIRKKIICNEIGYNLIEFFYHDKLTNDIVLNKISKFIELK